MTKRGEIRFRVSLAAIMAIYFAGMHLWITTGTDVIISIAAGVLPSAFFLALLPAIHDDSKP